MYKCNKVYNKNINNSQSQKQVSLTQSLTGKSHYLVRRMHFTKLFSTLALVHLATSTALPVMENRDMSTEFEKRVSLVPLLLMLSTHLNAKEYFCKYQGVPYPSCVAICFFVANPIAWAACMVGCLAAGETADGGEVSLDTIIKELEAAKGASKV